MASKRGAASYPRGVELTIGTVIENAKGELLLTRSPKWHNKWVMPGGHVEPGERMFDTAVREGREETGLRLRPVAVVHYDELIGSSDFHRKAHFVYFDVYCRVVGGAIRLNEELSEWKWMRPSAALKLDLGEGYRKAIRNFIAYKRKAAAGRSEMR